MQTKNINHDPQGMVHRNCNDEMYGSASALPQRAAEFATMQNVNGNQSAIKSVIANPQEHVTQMRCDRRNNGPPVQTCHDCHRYQRQQQFYSQSHQSNSCTSTPILSPNGPLLKRQASLGQLDDHRKIKDHTVDGRFGLIQQKLRSFLSPHSRKAEISPSLSLPHHVKVGSTPSLNMNGALPSETDQTSSNVTLSPSAVQQSTPDASITKSFLSPNPEDEVDSLHLRDVCNKWFGRRQNGLSMAVASSLSSVHKPFVSDSPKLSHNIKTTLYDKVTQKNTICSSGMYNDYVTHYQSTVSHQLPPQNEHRYVEIRRIPNYSEVQSLPNSCPAQSNSEQHIVVVDCSDVNPNIVSRQNSLTVRSERPNIESYSATEIDTVMAANGKMKELPGHVDNGGLNDNYKSSSESGRGTMISNGDGVNNDGANANSSVDLTSIDSDQSTPLPTEKVWDQQNKKETIPVVNANCAAIEKMQRELQRILEDGSIQTAESEVEILGRNFQSQLSVVNESDSIISNTPPPQSVHQQIKTVQQSCGDSKYPSDKANATNKISLLPNSAQRTSTNKKHSTQLKQNTKQRYANSRYAKSSSNNKHYSEGYYSNVTKCDPQNSGIQNKMRGVNLVDCDNASTTTCRDGDSIAEYPDDLTSEYTANTSSWDKDEVITIRKQLNGLENMYAEIISLLGSRMKSSRRYTESAHRSRKKIYGSVSSITGRSSVTSRGTREYLHHFKKSDHRKQKPDDRIKRLESHVMTLARSVAQISSEIRTNHALSQELEVLRQDFNWIQEQLRLLKNNPQTGILTNAKSHHQSNGHISGSGKEWNKFRRDAMDLMNPVKVEKLTRFFGDEPPLLRQFLKKLGYEKYARNFESEKIGINEMPYLSEERFQRLGIPMGPRMRIMQEANAMLKNNSKDHYSIYAIV